MPPQLTNTTNQGMTATDRNTTTADDNGVVIEERISLLNGESHLEMPEGSQHGMHHKISVTNNNNESGDKDTSPRQHRIDTVPIMDPDAVDFSPVFVGFSGNAVNYHSQEDSFHKPTSTANTAAAMSEKPILSHLDHTHNTSSHSNSPKAVFQGAVLQRQLNGLLNILRNMIWYLRDRMQIVMEFVRVNLVSPVLNNARTSSSSSSSFIAKSGKGNSRKTLRWNDEDSYNDADDQSVGSYNYDDGSNDDEPEGCKYVIFGMGFFVFLVMLSNRMDHTSTISMAAAGSTMLKKSVLTTPTIDVKHAPSGTIIPPNIKNAYADIDDLPFGIMDTAIYWHIPRSGGTTMKLIMSMCMGRVVASEQGVGHQLDDQLEILKKPYGNFANVDTTTPLGIQRSVELGLVPSRMVDVIVTPQLHEATKLFDEHHRGRLFTVVRDPVERLASLYYFLRMPDQTAAVTLGVSKMTLEQFASEFSENWMVRSLTNSMTGPIDKGHLDVAKEILRKKFLIGLLDDKTETLRRIEAYFSWKLPSRVAQTCKNNMMYFEPQSKNTHDPVDRNSRAYEILKNRNQLDLELYEYSKLLFQEQKELIQRLDK